jgi:uncharacterized MnhB-related membrane protein
MIFEVMLILMTLVTIAAVQMKDLMHAVILLAGADAMLAIVFFLLAAPDIAITQAAVSAGLSTVIYVIAIHKTRRHENE